MYLKVLIALAGLSSLWSAEEIEENLSPTAPESLSSFSGESMLIGGVISPSSGLPCLRVTDLIAKGAESLELSRVYISPAIPSKPFYKNADRDLKAFYSYLKENYEGWTYFPQSILIATYSMGKMELNVRDASGITLTFHVKDGEAYLSSSLGICNVQDESPSGAYDARNTQVTLNHEKKTITVHTPDGYTRYYSLFFTTHSSHPKKYYYHLQKEVLPSGKICKYQYDQNHLSRVESWDPKERFMYASIEMGSIPRSSGTRHFTTHTGLSAEAHYEIRKQQGKYVVKGVKSNPEYKYTISSPPLVTKVNSPFYQESSQHSESKFWLDTFSGKNLSFACTYQPGNQDSFCRVNSLSLPVGKKGEMLPLYEIYYMPPKANQSEGKTEVGCKDGTYTRYNFTSQFLLQSIQYYNKEKVLGKEKKFFWTQDNRLKAIELYTGKKRVFRKRFFYDSYGNPIKETFAGDLTGSGKEEKFVTLRSFSQDGKNLLLQETKGDKKVFYTYLKGTNLLTSQITQGKEKIYLREFFEYDDSNNLVASISDDGTSFQKEDLTGVTERLITRRILRQKAPFLHMVDTIEHRYLDQGEEKLIKRVHYSYDKEGNVSQEEVYGADGKLAYTLQKTYDERGNLLSETNPLGQKALYGYNQRGQCILATSFSQKQEMHHSYDKKGRERFRIEKTALASHKTSFAYDIADNLIQKIDFLGNVTSYQVDTFTKKVVQTIYPSLISEKGSQEVKTSSSFDFLGLEKEKKDGRGFSTHYTHNAYGSITSITYPNKAKETFLYYPNGTLHIHTNTDGLSIEYTYDALDRVLSKAYLYQGTKVAEETFVYNSLHLLAETDKEGQVKTYTYTPQGKIASESFLGKTTQYSYDSLGRISTTCKNHALWILYTRDLLDRVIEEVQTDGTSVLWKTSYAYDADGHRSSITRGSDTETFTYDAFGRQVEHKDALHNVTLTSYSENYVNALGQKVLQISEIDPKGTTTIFTKDTLGNTSQKEILNPQKERILLENFFYDPSENLLLHKEEIFHKTLPIKTLFTRYVYTPRGEKERMIRASGSPEERVYRYTYTPSGKIETKTLPNGKVLTYTYTPFGYVSSLHSSDGKVAQSFSYNRLGYLLQAADVSSSLERVVDPFGNILEEKLNGITTQISYDLFDRHLSLKLPDGSKIQYTYDPLFLRKVERLSPSEEVLYTHCFSLYDLRGHLLQEKLSLDLGDRMLTYDAKGQKTSIESPYFSQKCTYDTLGNVTESIFANQSHSLAYDDLSQLTQDNSDIFGYDSHYNRLSKNTESAEINSLDEMTSQGQVAYAYDLNGNQTLKKSPTETLSYEYDALNRLIETSSENTRVQYIYDPLDRRLAKILPDKEEHYFYLGNIELGMISSGVIEELAIPGPIRKGMTEPIAIELKDKVFVPMIDIQHNVRHLVDPAQRASVRTYDYNAFGESSFQKEELFNPWRYGSKRLDLETHLLYFGKRYYDPSQGRWISCDPIGSIDSTNLYQFVLNNPLRYYDPDGRFAFTFALPLWGSAAGGSVGLGGIGSVGIAALFTPAGWLVAAGVLAAGVVAWKAPEIINYANTHFKGQARDSRAGDVPLTGSSTPTMRPPNNDDDDEEDWYKKIENKETKKDKKPNYGPEYKTPRNSGAQNRQSEAARRAVERVLKRQLKPEEWDPYHDLISRQGYGYKEIVEEGIGYFSEHSIIYGKFDSFKEELSSSRGK